MSESNIKFKFPLVDPSGVPITSQGILGSVGFAETYKGKTIPEDAVVAAIRALHKSNSEETITDQQANLVRSFATQWLIHGDKKLSAVVAYSIEMQKSIHFLSQIGFLDRTATAVSQTAIGITGIVLTWDQMFSDATDFGSAFIGGLVMDVADLGLSTLFKSEIKERFGEPGRPVKRSDFDLKPILVFLQCCHFRSVIERIEGDEKLTATLEEILDHRIFSLFMLNSRQLEGLACSGSSEATAAVAAHAAIALGLSDLRNRETIFEKLEQRISAVENEDRRKEARSTLKAIEHHVSLKTSEIERQLSRQLMSSATTEALDLAVMPMRASMQLMSLVSGGMQSMTPGQYSQVFSLLKQGFDSAESAANASPDVLAAALKRGIGAEAWTRQQFDRALGFLTPKRAQEAEEPNPETSVETNLRSLTDDSIADDDTK